MKVLFLLVLLLFSCGDIFLEEDLIQRPQSKRCSECHGEIFKEWEKSRHAMAWKSEKFKLESENYTKTKCLSCHAPHQVDPEIKPALRVEFKEETRAMHGLHEVLSPLHPSRQDLVGQKVSAEVSL